MKRFLPLVVMLVPLIAAAQEVPQVPEAVASARNRSAEAIARDAATFEKSVGDLMNAKLQINWHIAYEQIQDCGFYPQETRLECVLRINQNFGYAGPVGSRGSFEFVSFFVDFGIGMQYVGSGIVQMADGSAGTRFAVYRDFNPPGGPRTSNGGSTAVTQTNGPILKARAILSWGVPTPSTNPNAQPVWGNVVDFPIRMMPIR
jgi:hypothetical protein